MRKRDYLLKDEGGIDNFLGVSIKKSTDSKNNEIFTMTQTGLNTSSTKFEKLDTPATPTLQPESMKPALAEAWNYLSIIGKLNNFLALNSRPDIAFAVH